MSIVDTREFDQMIERARMSTDDMRQIISAGGAVVQSVQRQLVPVDTSATKNSIAQYIEASADHAENDVGPSTGYAPYIEYGTSNPNYPVQPYVVPSGTGQNREKAIRAMETTAGRILKTKVRAA